MTVDYRAIRKQALTLCGEHRKPLTAVAFTALLPSFILVVAGIVFSPQMPVLSSVLQFCVNVLLYPVVILGSAHVYLRTWRGETPKYSMLFCYIGRDDYIKAVCIGFVFYFISRSFSVFDYIGGLFADDDPVRIYLVLINLIFTFIGFWLTMRLILVQYLYSVGFSRNVFALIGESYRRTRGQVGSFFWFGITVSWWRFLLPLLGIFFAARRVGEVSTLNRVLIFSAVFSVTLLLFSLLLPYSYLAIAGLANKHIPSERAARKAAKQEAK